MKKGRRVFVPIFVVFLVAAVAVGLFLVARSRGVIPVPTPVASGDPKRQYTVTQNGDGTSTLKVPYYGYQITYPSQMRVDNSDGYIDEFGSAVATYGILRQENGLIFSISIDVDKKKIPLTYEAAFAKPIYGTLEIRKFSINGLYGYERVGIVNAAVPGPKPVAKEYVLDLGNSVFAVITEGLIGYENNPHQYQSYETQLDKVVSTFKLLK